MRGQGQGQPPGRAGPHEAGGDGEGGVEAAEKRAKDEHLGHTEVGLHLGQHAAQRGQRARAGRQRGNVAEHLHAVQHGRGVRLPASAGRVN